MMFHKYHGKQYTSRLLCTGMVFNKYKYHGNSVYVHGISVYVQGDYYAQRWCSTNRSTMATQYKEITMHSNKYIYVPWQLVHKEITTLYDYYVLNYGGLVDVGGILSSKTFIFA